MALTAVDVRAGGPRLVVGPPQPLFQTNAEDRVIRNDYAASPDGQRFVMSPLIQPSVSRLVAVLNWTAGLARKP